MGLFIPVSTFRLLYLREIVGFATFIKSLLPSVIAQIDLPSSVAGNSFEGDTER
jgi:hypothetical protein